MTPSLTVVTISDGGSFPTWSPPSLSSPPQGREASESLGCPAWCPGSTLGTTVTSGRTGRRTIWEEIDQCLSRLTCSLFQLSFQMSCQSLGKSCTLYQLHLHYYRAVISSLVMLLSLCTAVVSWAWTGSAAWVCWTVRDVTATLSVSQERFLHLLLWQGAVSASYLISVLASLLFCLSESKFSVMFGA